MVISQLQALNHIEDQNYACVFFFFKEKNGFGKTQSDFLVIVYFHSPFLHKQTGTRPSPLWQSTLTPHCQQEPMVTPLYQTVSSALLYLLPAKSQIGGWEMFCGPNKRTKVVKTPLYKSVGGWLLGVGRVWARRGQLVFQGPACSLATVTHGEAAPGRETGADQRQFCRDSWFITEQWLPFKCR